VKALRQYQLVHSIRFSEFQRVGDRECDQIGNIAHITKCRAVPCIRFEELYSIYGEAVHKVKSCTNIPIKKLKLSRVDDINFLSSVETNEGIARTAFDLNEGVALGNDLNILRSERYGTFFSYLLNCPSRHTIAGMVQVNSIVHLFSKQLSQVFKANPNRIEQQKIADCLTLQNDLISAIERRSKPSRSTSKG